MKREIERQLFHLLFGIGIIAVVSFLQNFGIILLSLFLVFCVLVSCTYHTHNFKLAQFFIRRYGRDLETQKFPGKGGIVFLGTSLAVLSVFPRPIAFAAIVICALGDSISHLYGRYWGVVPNPLSKEKKLDGTVMGVLAGVLGAIFFVPFVPALIGSLVAMLVESWDWLHTHVDDNFTVITTAAIVMFLLQNVI